MQAPERTTTMIDELRRLGVRLSIDDFGTGYSSLDYLDRFSVDTLKIDRHFIARMHTDERSRNIVRTIVSLAHNLRMSVVAEGTETLEQINMLREMQCDSMQGFFFSRPIPAPRFESLLQTQHQNPVSPEIQSGATVPR